MAERVEDKLQKTYPLQIHSAATLLDTSSYGTYLEAPRNYQRTICAAAASGYTFLPLTSCAVFLTIILRVCYIYTVCGHAFAMVRPYLFVLHNACSRLPCQPDEYITCDNPKCKFSPAHPPTCSGESCKRGCWQ